MRSALYRNEIHLDRVAFWLWIANVFTVGVLSGIVLAWVVSYFYIWPSFG